ncbi:MAG: hypothetical protein K0U59_04780 [Gammaproteobacteria bacterium]|nr:hypothetical protein [Gammaproteobacteria bacterium]
MNLVAVTAFFKELGQEIFAIAYGLFKILIPTILIIKALNLVGAIDYLGVLLSPLMHFVGLPDLMGVVWATTLVAGMVPGMLVYVDIAQPLSVAQVSVLSTMMLMAHALPLEGAIAKKTGTSIWLTLVVRIGSSLLLGWLLFNIYSYGNWLQQPSTLAWQPDSQDDSIYGWLLGQGKNLLTILLIIAALAFSLKILKLLGIEKLMVTLLQPTLRLIGIGHKAATFTIVGITLGLSYGGALLIKEAQTGHIPPRDIFASILMLGLLHSIIEDTILVLLLGADLSAVLWGRIVFSFVIVAVVTRLTSRINDSTFQRVFHKPVHG